MRIGSFLKLGVGLATVLAVYRLLTNRRATAPSRMAADHPRSPAGAPAAAKRLLCIQLMDARLQFVEKDFGETECFTDHEDAEIRFAAAQAMHAFAELHRDLDQSIRETGLWDFFSTRERQLLETPIGRWTPDDRADMALRSEAASVLAWALGLIDALPPYDRAAAVDGFRDRLPELDRIEPFVEEARLRPGEEIRREREVADLWVWRCDVQERLESPEPRARRREKVPVPEGLSFEQLVCAAAVRGETEGFFIPIENDFPAYGKPYAELNDEQTRCVRRIARERLHALNWLCGYARD